LENLFYNCEMKHQLLLLISFLSLTVQGQFWQSPGPAGGSVHSYVKLDDMTLVGTACGIYRTTNGGASFYEHSQQIPSGKVISMVNDDGVLIACVESKGLYRSTDEGVTWTLSRSGAYLRQDGFGQQNLLLLNGMCVARNYSDDDTLYFSNDNGLSWQVQAFNNSLFNNVMSAGGNLYTECFNGSLGSESGLYRSTDMGVTWEFSGTGLSDDTYVGNIYEMDGTLYLLSDYVFSSTNNGLSWQQASTVALPSLFSGVDNFYPQWTLFDGNRFYSQNGGNAFVQVATWMPGEDGWVAFDEIPTEGNTNTFYLVDNTPCLSRLENQFRKESTDWQSYVPFGINAGKVNGIFASGDECLSTTAFLFRNIEDVENSWSLINPSNIPDVDYDFYSIARINEHILMGIINLFGVLDIMHSADEGVTWQNTAILDIAPDSRFMINDDELLVYGGYGGYPHVYGVNEMGEYTTDYGSPYGYTFDDKTVDLIKHNGALYALTTSYSGQFSKILTWEDGATFWSQSTQQIDGNFFGGSSLASWQNDLFIGLNITEDYNGGVLRSSDNGDTWTSVGSGLEGVIVNRLLPSGDSLFAGTNAGVFVLANGSSVWENLSGNLPVNDVVELARTNWFLYARLADGGVWRLGLSDQVGIAEEEAGTVSTYVFPNPCRDFLFVKGLSTEPYEATFRDMQGKIVKQDQLTDVSKPLSTEELLPGIYMLQLEGKHSIFSFTIAVH
jgi:hypothetical protein